MNNVEYGDIFKSLLFDKTIENVLEIGILDGYSLEAINNNTNARNIKAYDIFDEFEGNCANRESLESKFSKNNNISINYGDFFNLFEEFDNDYFDLIHIDIANNGNTYRFAIENYLPKLKNNGLLICEGGIY